jgi:hypothetical protein
MIIAFRKSHMSFRNMSYRMGLSDSIMSDVAWSRKVSAN